MATYLRMISPTAQGMFNIKFAKLAGLQTAVYWSALLEVMERVRDKNTCDANGFFTLQRPYITERTSLSEEEQYECDNVLTKLALLERGSDNNIIRLNLIGYTSMILDDDPSNLAITKKASTAATKKGKAEGKRIGIIKNLNSVVATESEDVQKAFATWIDVVYDKGICKKAQVQFALDTLNKFTSNDEIKIAVLKIGALSGYRELEWAIQKYNTLSSKQPVYSIGTTCSEMNLTDETF